MKSPIYFFIWLMACSVSFAQKRHENFNYYIFKAESPVKIDGKADEKAWEGAQVATDFYQVLPMDTSCAMVKTDVKFCYDDKNLYVLFINYNHIKGSNMVESMRRDFSFGKNDNDLLFIDTFNDLTTGFSFGSNARGGQWDGLMYAGSTINLSWDNKWSSEVSFDEDKWIWEAAIPFKTLRYKEDNKIWGINFSRLDLKTTEKSSWTPIPRQFPTASLAFTGNLVWDVPPPSPGANVSVIPFVFGGVSKNHEKGAGTTYDRGIGFDAKIGLTSSLNLDLTVNPDFSQVEVDVQQTNLDRFELFFPERRQFFLENGDMFNNFGFANIRPFFSRRIGLNAPLLFGAKLSGKLNKNWRLGMINTQTGVSGNREPGSNFSVLTVQRQVFKRSFISAMVTNRETVTPKSTKDLRELPGYNRTVGLEYNLASADNAWVGKAFLLKTFSPLSSGNNFVWAAELMRLSKKVTARLLTENVGGEVQGNEIGYVRRRDYALINPEASYLFFPKGGRVLSHGPVLGLNYIFSKSSGKYIESTNILTYKVTFRSQSVFTLWGATDYVKLNSAFDPTNFVGDTLATGTTHDWKAWGTTFVSKPQALLTYSFATRYGGYYADGRRLRLEGEVGYRFQPYVSVAMRANYNYLRFFDSGLLPQSLVNSDHALWLVGPRIDVTLTNKIFFTNFVQYNNQTNNVNINTRFQWRYSPASDLFLVYTDNYYSDTFKVRNRALVVKFTYWWNV